jgi:hypothetical protein
LRRGNNIVSVEGNPMYNEVRLKLEKRSSIQEVQLTWTQESQTLISAHIELKVNSEEHERERDSSERAESEEFKYYNSKYVDALFDSS